MQKGFTALFIYLFAGAFYVANGQTLIMNEVSNGPTGNQEYVEFVVVSDSVTYDCNSTTPPCIDIRGWIFDDNSGYHGNDGIAQGAVRFSQDPIWSCVPLGTIIVLYNNADRNPSLPADDLSLSDGNCTVVAPLNSTLFESNTTTPGAVACSYPSSGWVSGGNWNFTVLANTGDCARIVNLNGCEVFSVCYGPDSLNNLIYFSGAGGQRVYYFNGGTPNSQANWSSGSASPAPGSQTPGAPNNAANAAYIGQFNNNCTPITPIQVTATATNSGCTCNGSATATASGSIPGYSYEWLDASYLPIGQTTATATGLCPGTYHVIATSHIGCPDTATVTVGSSATISMSIAPASVCSGSAATLSATPSLTGGTYSWSPGGSTGASITVSPTASTQYTCTYTLGGCSTVTAVSVTVLPVPTVIISPVSVCTGSTVTLNPSVSPTGGNFLWSPGGQTASSLAVNPSITTTYSLSYDLNGCVTTASATVTVNQPPVVTVNSAIVCTGASAVLSASGATSYVWSNGGTGSFINVSPTSSSSYTVTGTLNGCTGTATGTVNVTPLPVITVNDFTICPGQTAVLNASGATAYSWSSGQTTSGISVTPTSTTAYTVTGTTNGCSSTAVATVYLLAPPVVTVTSATICNGDSVNLSAAGAGTYAWSTGSTGASINVSPTTTTNYTVIGASGSCTDTAFATVSVRPSPAVTTTAATVCAGQSATLTASGATQFLWDNGTASNSVSVTPAFSSTYTVTGTDANGCTATAVSSVTVNPLPSLTVTNFNSCPGQAATLSASGATTYLWSDGSTGASITVTPAATTSYSVTGTSSGCSTVATATVFILPPPNVLVASTTICAGATVNLSATGATDYVWSTGTTTSSITVSPISTTAYTVIGSIGGCSDTTVALVTVNPIPLVTLSPATVCAGQSVTLTAGGATSYSWNNGSSGATITVSPASTTNYTVTGTTSGCNTSVITTVTVNPLPSVTVTASSICPGQTATLTATGAAGYSWNSGQSGSTISVSPAATSTYTVTGTTSGCSSIAVGTVTVLTAPNVIVISDSICNGTSATIIASGASSYNWSTGGTGNSVTVSPTSTTTYTVTGTTGGCTSSAVATITVLPRPTVTVNSPSICSGQSITLTASGASSYLWGNGATAAGITVSPVVSTTYTVTGRLNNCIGTAVSVVNVTPAPVVTSNQTTICEGQTATISATGALSYLWSSGATGASISVTPSVTTAYTVVGTTAGCTDSSISTVTVNPLPVIQVNSVSICPGSTATLTATGANTFSWSNGFNSSAINVSPASNSTYTVTGTTAGCTSTAVATVTISTVLTVDAGASDTICSGSSTTLNVSPAVSGSSYTWLPVTGLSNSGIANPVANPLSTTTYQVTVVDANGCSGTDFVTVEVDPGFTVAATAAPVSCNGSADGQASALPSGGYAPYSFAWNTGGTLVIEDSLAVGTYSVVVTDAGGCTASSTATVTAPSPLSASVNYSTASSCFGSCDGMAAILASGGTGTLGYAWNTTPVQTIAVATGLCAGAYSCIVTDANGCTTSVATSVGQPVPVDLTPVTSVTPCNGGSTSLSVTASGGNGPYTYAWTPSAGLTMDTIPDPVASPSSASTYTVVAVDASGCSSAPQTVNVPATATAPIQIQVNGLTQICPGATAQLNAIAGSGNGGPYTYSWSPSVGLSDTTSSQPMASPFGTTTYTVAASDGCSTPQAATITVTVLANPTSAIGVNINSGCSPLCVTFVNGSSAGSGAAYSWDFGANEGGSAAPQPTHCFTNPGNYSISLTATSAEGCVGDTTIADMITVHASPTALFISTPDPASMYAPAVSFFDRSSADVVDWRWDFGDGSATYQGRNPVHTYPYGEPGSYQSSLIVQNAYGCLDTILLQIDIRPEYSFYIPNCFTPNGDGFNETFNGSGVGIKEYKLMIFDRWGDLIWQTETLHQGWDGRANNGTLMSQQDAFDWKVILTDVFGKQHIYLGRVSIVK